MKKLNLVLFPTLALAIFAGVNLFATGVSWDAIKYDCNLEEGSSYYVCEEDSNWEYLCWGVSCEYSGVSYWCEKQGDNYRCRVSRVDKGAEQENGWYYFSTNRLGGYECGSMFESSLNVNNLRKVSSYWEYYCYPIEWWGRSYYGCDDYEGWYFCPTELYSCSEGIEWYSCELDELEWNYYCEQNSLVYDNAAAILSSDETYTCYDIFGYNEDLNNCYEPELRGASSYVCPYEKYSCTRENWKYRCTEGYQWNDDNYYYCKRNHQSSPIKDRAASAQWEYSCYQTKDNGHRYTYCYWEDEDEYLCYPMYACELDKDGYNCVENTEGDYYCQNYNVAIPQDLSSVNGGYYCRDNNDNRYDYCSENNAWDGYFCPVKWWTKISDWDYQCLPDSWRYTAEYDEGLEQCIYTVNGYNGKDIVIMSANIWITQQNPVWLYYQWWKWYGFKSYFWNNEPAPAYNIEDYLDDDEYDLFQSYELSTLSNTWSVDEDPCPTWFHVPSMSEWNNLFISWCENDEECDTRDLTKSANPDNQRALNDSSRHGAYSGIVNRFVDDYNLKLLWSRDENEINMFGMMWDYRSSERLITGDEDYHYWGASDMSSWWLTLYPEWWVWPLWFFSHMAASVRCFANVEDDVEVATPIALDFYKWWCTQWNFIEPESAIQVLEDSVLCPNGGYLWRKFVPANETINLAELDRFFPSEWNQWAWYLENNQDGNRLTTNTFTRDTKLYAFQEESLDEYTITFDSDGWRPVPDTQNIVHWSQATAPTNNPTKNWYVFWGWTLNWEAFDFSEPITSNITLKAKWDILHYTITYKDGETTVSWLTPSSYTVEDSITLPTLPAKTGYKFDGWSDNGTKITKIQAGNTWDKTLVAIWTEDKPSWWSSGWFSGWGSSHSKWWGGNKSDVKSVDKEPSTPTKEENKSEPKPVVPWKWVNNTDKANPNQELFDAYEWAYDNGLTKYANMSDARMDDLLNRQEMAKISTIFATKFQWETPNEKKRNDCSQYPDLWKTTKDMQEFIIQSCELGYMGYRANGVDYLERFRPYTPVSVAEVSIILSRIMWQNRYAIDENLWYQWHLHAVYENNLLDNISKPFDYIARKDAYIMLYRISKTL